MRSIMVLGHGEVDRSSVLRLASRFVSETEGGVRFIIPVSDKQSKAALWVAEWAQVSDRPYDVVTSADDLDERQDSVVQSAVRSHGGDISDALKRVSEGGALLVAWDDRPETEALVTKAIQRGLSVHDLTSDLEEMVLDDESGTPEEESDDDFPEDGFPPVVYVESGDRTDEILRRLEAIEAKVDSLTRQRATR